MVTLVQAQQDGETGPGFDSAAHDDEHGEEVPMRAPSVVLVVVAVAVLAGCGPTGPDPALTPMTSGGPPSPPPTPEPGTVLYLTADELASGPRAVGDRVPDISEANNTAVVAATESDITPPLSVVPKVGGGRAFDYPEPCADPSDCLRPILEVASSETLNPGSNGFTVSADVRMKPSDATAGSNLVQKGYSTGGGGQWKMQVDGIAGRPSCVIVAPGTDTIHQVESSVSIADSGWHNVTCVRAEGSLRIVVDGEVDSVGIPEGLTLRNDAPLRIGGKSIKPGNDPFHGEIDNIQVTIAR